MLLASYRNDPTQTGKLDRGTVRRILAYGRPYQKELSWFLVLVTVGAVLSVASPLLFKQIIDDGIAEGDAQLVTVLALLAALLALLDAGVSLAERWHSARIGEGLIHDLRVDVFDHVQKQSLAFFTRSQTGALVSRINNDVIGAQRAFTATLSGVVSNTIALVLTVGAMLTLSWKLTMVSLALLPVFVIPAKRVGRKLSNITKESYELNAQMNNTMTERFNVSGAHLAKLFGRPEEDTRVFDQRAGRVRDIGVSSALVARTFFVALTLVAALATAAVYGIGGHLAIQDELTAGELVALALLLARLYGPLTALSNIRVDVMSALVSFQRVLEILDLEPLVKEGPDPRELPRGEALGVTFEEVRFRYPTRDEVSISSLESHPETRDEKEDVLQGLTLHLPAGTRTAVVGHSGAGKSTLAALVTRLYDPQSGSVKLGGTDLRDVSLASIRDTVGVVSQDSHLYHDTLRANLLYAKPDATEDEMRRALADAQVLELVEGLENGLDTVVGERGHRLSGGEKQRIAIARVLLKGPGVVVLDEATAHLDSESERGVQRALEKVLSGRTSLVIAHRLSTIFDADNIVVLEKGEVVESGTHAELLAQGGTYAELYRTQYSSSNVPAQKNAEDVLTP